MAIRAATMSHMNMVEVPARQTKPGGLLRKLFLLNLLMTAAVLGVILLKKYYWNVPQFAAIFFVDALLGLVAGFSSRFVLRNRNWYLVSGISILLVAFGMILIGDLTRWILGVGPIYIDYKVIDQIQKLRLDPTLWDQIRRLKVNPYTLFDFRLLNWFDLIQLETGLFMAGLALNAWRRKTTTVPVSVQPVSPSASRIAEQKRGRRRQVSTTNTSSDRWFPKFNFSHTPSEVQQSQLAASPEVKMLRAPLVKKPKRKPFHRRPKIQFALVEEHKCPFCLESVTHNDPRGVKECDVCHSLHHADCWEITGVCQVPHLNT